MLKLVIVHHHFRPGGVRRVIEVATPHVVAHWPERIRSVVLGTGETPSPTWLRAFRSNFHGTSVKVMVQPAFDYVVVNTYAVYARDPRVLQDVQRRFCKTSLGVC
jgi:hypothetical protein